MLRTRLEFYVIIVTLSLFGLFIVACVNTRSISKRYDQECISKAKIISWLELSPENISAEDACAVDVIYTNQEILYNFDGMVIVEKGHKGTIFITPER